MKTLKKISRRIKQHATKEIRCILKRQGYDYTLREIRNMLYYDKQLKSWAVRVLIEKYSRRELGAVIANMRSLQVAILWVIIRAGIVPLPKSNDYGTSCIFFERHRLRY